MDMMNIVFIMLVAVFRDLLNKNQ